MALTKYKLGDLIELCDDQNVNETYSLEDVKGIATSKEFITTKADMNGVGLQNYRIVFPHCFAYVSDTSRRGDKISLAYNSSNNTYIVSSISIVFKVSKSKLLLSDYLFMYFNRPEFDRYSRFNSWGSARETFSWEEMCDIEISIPPIEVQQKYVDIYNAMVENQKAYEKGLDDLKLACDGFIEDLRRKLPSEKIGKYLQQKNARNSDGKIKRVMGLSTKKEFRVAQSRVNVDELNSYKIMNQDDFAFVPTTDTWKVLAFAVNNFDYQIVVSPIYEVFSIEKEHILPAYLAMWLSRKEFDRYARYHSWGSARENFNFNDMCEVAIPIPNTAIQQSIVDIYNQYIARKEINEKLKAQIKDLCPILIKGSLQEA